MPLSPVSTGAVARAPVPGSWGRLQVASGAHQGSCPAAEPCALGWPPPPPPESPGWEAPAIHPAATLSPEQGGCSHGSL